MNAGRPPLYNRKRIAEIVNEAIQTENHYAPYSDPGLVALVEDAGEQCSASVIYHLRRHLGIPPMGKRRAEYRAKREKIGGLKNGR